MNEDLVLPKLGMKPKSYSQSGLCAVAVCNDVLCDNCILDPTDNIRASNNFIILGIASYYKKVVKNDASLIDCNY